MDIKCKFHLPARRFPLGQMPTLEIDNKVICHSMSICRYLATEFGLYGANSQEQAIIDQINETLNDMTNEMVKIIYHSGFDDETKVNYYYLCL